jgi:ABC-type multidrug transport system ATPase subunit
MTGQAEHGEPLLAVRSLSKSYGPRRVLDRVSFTVRSGEMLGLIGPNGAGKTTLFECLAGLLPAEGEALDAGGRSLRPEERRSAMFYVPDGIAPWRDQSLGRVVRFFRDLWGVPAERVESVVEALKLRNFLGRWWVRFRRASASGRSSRWGFSRRSRS